MSNPKVTRTYGPIHFEDLDPHRFEDLVRELIYDYKPWQTIEATGRGGGDDGFDVRAYERVGEAVQLQENAEDLEINPMDGNLWMIQCKREKEIGPKRVAVIISETIDQENPPYSYILVAPANFSKESYDVFRLELQKRGVMEFYLWGKGELEDMLHLPKNDRILFTFFGISLVSRRKSLATEVRFAVNNKNKLIRILGDRIGNVRSILVRDLKDTKYPYKNEYKDFEKHPKWKEYIAKEFHPLGLIFQVSEYYAHVDPINKTWDYTDAVNLIFRESERGEEEEKKREIQEKVEGVWEYFPRANQAKFIVYGMIRFDDMAVIDDKGDTWNNFPHIFVDFQGASGPFAGFLEFLEKNRDQILLKGYSRAEIFPKFFPKPKNGTVHKTKSVVWDEQTLNRFKNEYDSFFTLYDGDSKYDFLKKGDIISVANSQDSRGEVEHIQITHKVRMKARDYLEQNKGIYNIKNEIERQVGKKVQPKEDIDIYEFKRAYKWRFNPKSK